jgi:hypothetical protein
MVGRTIKLAVCMGVATLFLGGGRFCLGQDPTAPPVPGSIPAQAEAVVGAPVVTPAAPAATIPGTGPATMPVQGAPVVAPGVAPRAGIGTTPYLGNTRGMGAYSVNYDRVRYVGPQTRQVYRTAPRRGLFRRWRWWR